MDISSVVSISAQSAVGNYLFVHCCLFLEWHFSECTHSSLAVWWLSLWYMFMRNKPSHLLSSPIVRPSEAQFHHHGFAPDLVNWSNSWGLYSSFSCTSQGMLDPTQALELFYSISFWCHFHHDKYFVAWAFLCMIKILDLCPKPWETIILSAS